jgi:hypothetical protein
MAAEEKIEMSGGEVDMDERQEVWHDVLKIMLWTIIGVAILLLLMRLFLV